MKENQVVKKEEKMQPLIKLDKVYESLRVAEYCVNDGIGEIVDNAIEARPQDIYIDIETQHIRFDGKKRALEVVDKIVVTDNGLGMSVETLHKCLVLGETNRTMQNTGYTEGIGRFGVGLTLGGISLARRIDVYSRKDSEKKFMHCYIDLDEIQDGNQIEIKEPIQKNPPTKYMKRLEGTTGTIIILNNCDRLQYDVIKGQGIEYSTHETGLSNFLGRTYRKFIYGGINIYLNEKRVYLHDPLYLMGPTKFDVNGSMDSKAKLIGTSEIELPIPGDMQNRTSKVKVTMSLLPEEWRVNQGDGDNAFAKQRKIPDNEGISILRAEREVFYDKIPAVLGPRGASGYEAKDRFWSCELAFSPELDEYFHVRYIKRGIEPISSLRQRIQQEIAPTIKQLRKEITDYWKNNKAQEAKQGGIYSNAEQVMEKTGKTVPRVRKTDKLSEEEANNKLKEIVKSTLSVNKDKKNKENQDVKFEELKRKNYSIEPVSYPQTILFEPEYLLGKVIIKINVKHPFYEKIFVPLCGELEDSVEMTLEQQKNRDAILLLLLSYAQAEGMFADNEETQVLMNCRSQWGSVLATAINNL